MASTFSGIYKLIYNKYYVDEVYDATVISPTIDGSRAILWRIADATIIDGAVNGAGKVASGIGSLLRKAQGGYIRNYAAWVVAGTILAIVVIGMQGGAK